MPDQRRLVEQSLARDESRDGCGRRRFKPGEVEAIAVSTVVREALWDMLQVRSVEPSIEQLVVEAARAAGEVMGRAREREAHPAMVLDADTGALAPRDLPEGWRGRLANVERMLTATATHGTDTREGGEALDLACAEVRRLIDFEPGA